MKKFSKNLLGTTLEIGIDSVEVDSNYIQELFSLVKNFEDTYSRFIHGNYLWKLNNARKAELNEDLKTMLNIAKKANKLSNGHFDITILPYLENKGYGIEKETMQTPTGMENIKINENSIVLENNIKIDLGGIGKGYMVDVLYDNLVKHYNHFIINFGGDIRVNGSNKSFLLEDPLVDGKYIGKTIITDLALASSGSRKRQLNTGHHLIDAKSGESSSEIIGVYVTHKLASIADCFATAIYVSPLHIGLDIIKRVNGLEAMVVIQDGKIYKSSKFNYSKI